jgi:hypothetical protein
MPRLSGIRSENYRQFMPGPLCYLGNSQGPGRDPAVWRELVRDLFPNAGLKEMLMQMH